MHSYRDFMLRELERRQRKNPSYSLRAFARDLEVPSSRLSEILNRKMGLSETRAVALADKLNLSSSEREFFIDLALAEHARSAVIKEMAQRRIQTRSENSAQPSENEFNIRLKREDYEKVVEKIKNFRRELASEMEASTDKDSVYCLAVQLFELTNTEP